MNNSTVEVTLLTSNKIGILAGIMMITHELGLMVSRNKSIKLDSDNSSIFIQFTGIINCSKQTLIDKIESHPEVYSVREISFKHPDESINSAYDENSPISNQDNSRLRKHDLITSESIQIVEEELIKLIGPAAPMLVISAVEQSTHNVDLFQFLSEYLEGDEKTHFLALVAY